MELESWSRGVGFYFFIHGGVGVRAGVYFFIFGGVRVRVGAGAGIYFILATI